MKSSILLAAAASASLALAQNAPITQDNPLTASIQANLNANKAIQGTITAVSPQNGTGVNFNINFFSFPATGSPFSYYIASSTVPPSNDCSSLTSIFNPYSASATCKATDPSSCAVGALSAKHGTIDTSSATSFQVFYLDLYLSTEDGTEAYFGGKSIVVADNSGKPINCANFQASGTGSGSSSSSSSAAMSSATSSMSSAASAAASTMSSASSSGTGSASSASAAATSSAAGVAQRVLGSGAVVAAMAAFAL